MKLLNRFCFLIGIAFAVLLDGLRGRKLAINAVLTPNETSRGTESLDADATIAFSNAGVKKGSDDRHFALISTTQSDVGYGILLNNQVDTGEVGTVKKGIAIFGLWPESLPCVSDGTTTIAAGDRITHSATVAGQFRKMPTTSGQTYVNYGRARFAVAATAGDPISLVHHVPGTFTNP